MSQPQTNSEALLRRSRHFFNLRSHSSLTRLSLDHTADFELVGDRSASATMANSSADGRAPKIELRFGAHKKAEGR